MARLIYLKDVATGDEGIWIDSGNTTDRDIEADTGMVFQRAVPIDADVSAFPTDRLLIVE
jgi:hypothetical protein